MNFENLIELNLWSIWIYVREFNVYETIFGTSGLF